MATNKYKPRIWANCDAGCRWEVPHKSDFDNVAAFVEVPLDENGVATLEPYKKYRIFCEKTEATATQFDVTLTVSVKTQGSDWQTGFQGVDKPVYYSPKDNFDFELLLAGVGLADLSSGKSIGKITYRIDGELRTKTEEYPYPLVTDYDAETTITVSGATRVLQVNDNAVLEVVKDKQFVVTFTNTNGNWTADKTFDEIYQAITDGQVVIGKFSSNIYCLNYYNDYLVNFCKVTIDDEGLSVAHIAVLEDDTIEYTAKHTEELIDDVINSAINKVLNTEV